MAHPTGALIAMPEALAEVFPTWGHLLITGAVLVCAETVYVLFGFGAGLIAVSGLAAVLPDIQDVVVMLLLVNLPVEAHVVATSRRAINWRGVLRTCAGIAVGILVGTWVLKSVAPIFVLLLLGGFLMVAGTGFLVGPQRRPIRWPTWTATPLGLLAGTLAGAFGTGGPPLILYYQLGGTPKAVFRGNLLAIFLFTTAIRLPVYFAAGLVTLPRCLSAAAMLPAVIAGAYLGARVHIDVSESTFRRWVSLSLVVLGLVLIGSQISPSM